MIRLHKVIPTSVSKCIAREIFPFLLGHGATMASCSSSKAWGKQARTGRRSGYRLHQSRLNRRDGRPPHVIPVTISSCRVKMCPW
ncbi:hypothetical protein BJX96DRAFT_145903 [Aspergillus floccosus]